jgi:hypothetical protein
LSKYQTVFSTTGKDKRQNVPVLNYELRHEFEKEGLLEVNSKNSALNITQNWAVSFSPRLLSTLEYKPRYVFGKSRPDYIFRKYRTA